MMSPPKMKGPPRRSRSILEGRNWQCKFCDRSYLSSNSLVYHCRIRHKDQAGLEEFVKTNFKSGSKEFDKPVPREMENKKEMIMSVQSSQIIDPLADFKTVFHQLVKVQDFTYSEKDQM